MGASATMRRTAAAVRSSRPSPGPTTRARNRSAALSTSAAAGSSSAPSAVAGSAFVMTSVPDARAAASSPGTPHQTMPAPARMAAWLTNDGAPVMPPEPPTTSAPLNHLWASGARSGSSSARSRTSGTNTEGPPRSMPMSATSTSPAWPAPGWNTSPGLSAENVTVCEACTASPSTPPVWPFTPDGMSTATHGPSTASTAPATHAASPSSAPRNPVPNMASTNASARSSARSQSWRSTPASSVNTSTRTPHSRRARAVTCPSPPLLPLPHTTTTRRPYVPPISRRTVHATARPARSMSTSTGVPAAIVRRSASPISAGVSTGRMARRASR